MTVLWVAQAVTVTNGSKEVVVTSAPGNAITKVETSAYFHGVGFSLPYEIERTYNNGTNDVIVLYENWAGSSGSIGAVAAPSGAAVTRAANSLEELKSVYEAIADSVSTTASANSIPQRDSNGRIKAAPASASDDVVVKSQTGTAASKDVTTSAYDTTSGRLIKVGDFGLAGATALANTAPNSNLSEVEEASIVRADNANDKPDSVVGSGGTTINPGVVFHVNRYLNATAQTSSQLCFGHDNAVDGGSAMWHRSISGTNGPNPWRLIYDSDSADFHSWTMGIGKQKYGVGRTTSIIQFEFDIPGINDQPSGATFAGTVDIIDMETGTTVASDTALTYSPVSSDRIIVLEKTGLSGLTAGRAYRAVVTSTVEITAEF
jgi:hypothetical protein